MKKGTIIVLGLIFTVAIVFAQGASSGDRGKPMVKYPADYRHWTHVKSMLIQRRNPLYESLGGIHHIYANWRPFKALQSGKSFPDGAVLVLDLLQAKEENNSIVEGSRKFIAVMQKDSKEFMDTGGWGFEEFKGDTRERVVGEPKSSCFSCHEARKETDYVFSDYQE
jgi:hypothetical protein